MKLGLIGYSYGGKSAVFDALCDQSGAVNYGSVAVRVGSVVVPNDKLPSLAAIFKPKKIVHSRIEIVDLPSVGSAGIGGELLGVIQKLDALMLVIRDFENDLVPNPSGTVDHKRDLQKLKFDLLFQDIALLDQRIRRLQGETKGLKAAQQTEITKKCDALRDIQKKLEDGVAVRDQKLGQEHLLALEDTFLISRLPTMAVINGDEPKPQDGANPNGDPNLPTVRFCAKLELELNEFEEQEQQEMRAELGLDARGRDLLITTCYATCGLISFLTTGEDEVRAWAIKKGSTAQTAGGAIHSDIERGFIRAEVVAYNDFMEYGTTAKARQAGKLRQEGRDYIVADGDIINFLFNA